MKRLVKNWFTVALIGSLCTQSIYGYTEVIQNISENNLQIGYTEKEGIRSFIDVIQVDNVIAGSTYPGIGFDPIRVADQSGLYIENDIYPNKAVHTSGSPVETMWHTEYRPGEKAWIQFDLGQVEELDKMYIWNMNQQGLSDRGFKEVEIAYSEDGEQWQVLMNEDKEEFTFAKAQGNGNSPATNLMESGKPVDFGRINARYVRLTAKSNWGSDYYGLSEVMFTRYKEVSEVEKLKAEIENILFDTKRMKQFEYYGEGWSRFSEKIESAKVVIGQETASEEALKEALTGLEEAVGGLELKVNYAIGSQVEASEVVGDSPYYDGNKVVDNDFSTRWATDKKVTEDGKPIIRELKIELEEAQAFNQLVIYETSEYRGRALAYSVYTSEDGKVWDTWSEKNAMATTSIVGEVVSAKYIKVEVQETGDGVTLDEIRIFNDPNAIESQGLSPERPKDPEWIKPTSVFEPNIYQKRKAESKYGMFIHYGMNTFLNQEWTDGSASPNVYNPSENLDPESWVKAAWEGGMDFVVLVAKHHDGFSLWDSKWTEYDVASSNDPMDVVKEVSDACQKYGIKMGIYYSAWDRNWDRTHLEEDTGWDRRKTNQEYNDYMLNQIEELLGGEYGEVSELWIDGAWVKPPEDWELERLYNRVNELQPGCQIGINWTIKNTQFPVNAQGGEEILYLQSDFRLADPMFTKPGVDADPRLFMYGDELYYRPFEGTICINSTWFWNTGNRPENVMSSQAIANSYRHFVEQDNTLVINCGPNRDGLIEPTDLNGLYEGARALGIAKGEAVVEEKKPCEVEIRYVTQDGDIAATTQYIYGEVGEAYQTTSKYMENIGYRVAKVPENATGLFKETKQVIEYIYEDNVEIVKEINAADVEERINALETNASKMEIMSVEQKFKDLAFQEQAKVKEEYLEKLEGLIKGIDNIKINNEDIQSGGVAENIIWAVDVPGYGGLEINFEMNQGEESQEGDKEALSKYIDQQGEWQLNETYNVLLNLKYGVSNVKMPLQSGLQITLPMIQEEGIYYGILQRSEEGEIKVVETESINEGTAISFELTEFGTCALVTSKEKIEADKIQVTVTGDDQVSSGEQFEMIVGIEKNKLPIYAADLLLEYDKELFVLENIEAIEPIIMAGTKTITEGEDRALVAIEKGTVDKVNLLKLYFRAGFPEKTQLGEIKINESIFGVVNNEVTSLIPGNVKTKEITIQVNQENEEDVNGDNQVDVADLAIIAYYYYAEEDGENWEEAKKADINGDGIINILDLAKVAEKILGKSN